MVDDTSKTDGSKRRHWTIRLVVSFARIYVGYAVLAFLLQRCLVFPGTCISADEPTIDDTTEVTWLETSEGRVESWFLPPLQEVSSFPVVIYAHGNGELIDHIAYLAWPARAQGFGILLIEFPGYGRSEGSPSRSSIAEAFLAGYDWLIDRPDVDDNNIVLVGRSLGGGVVCDLAANRPSAALVLQSTFTDLPSMSSRFLLPGFLVRDRFNCANVLSDYEQPVLIFHGLDDDVVPFRHGRALFDAAQDAHFIAMSCRHNDCPPDLGAFWDKVVTLLRLSVGIEPKGSSDAR